MDLLRLLVNGGEGQVLSLLLLFTGSLQMGLIVPRWVHEKRIADLKEVHGREMAKLESELQGYRSASPRLVEQMERMSDHLEGLVVRQTRPERSTLQRDRPFSSLNRRRPARAQAS